MTDSVIDEILQARTHYQVLGLARDAPDLDTAALRKHYLRRSVKVHPDKNGDPRAKQAFQKVAQAWQVLSDDAARRAYDQALRNGNANLDDDFYDSHDDDDGHGGRRRPHTYYAGPPPSMQESLFVFASVVGAMMGGNAAAATNISEALYWGEKLMHQADRVRNGDSPAHEMTAREKATVAMALGSGLKVAGAAARGLGLEGPAQKMEQTARLAQMAGVGVMVADQPAVQAAIARGTESWRKLKGGIDVVRSVLGHQQPREQSESQEERQQPRQQQRNEHH